MVSKKKKVKQERKSKLSLLIADDDPQTLSILMMTLELAFDADIDLASDGEVALRKFKANRYDLVITDMMMPHMDGYELVRRIRQIDADVPIIALTQRSNISELIGQGPIKHICKPCSPNELQRVVDGLLRLSASRNSNEV
jgi:DNA-binding response OmpR family regulator